MDTDTVFFLEFDAKNNRNSNRNFEHQGNLMKIG